MINSDIQKARKLIEKKPYLVWSTQSYDKLSPERILESVISYGDWVDFIKLTEIFGMKKCAKLFEVISGKRRNNLRPKTQNYFSRYFRKYA
ncbi:hypothetical protein A2982_01495 [candidate division WWE3 bacterium RIFCSPLOWO2_01_FULL_39_13]|uniref:Uncharacterized protein n=1 Tax=candidate division WWE3 bacterium RIFCSPLOWO2_01_FULL_39_13 TaxID=1802624 RepID=A0A1F4V4P6_UNCKA|nr:MAG: hypothetical protein A2982_01495 [candidate division WWE3 bacterium RIFCSPLOWO2_01_FULL_39_13]